MTISHTSLLNGTGISVLEVTSLVNNYSQEEVFVDIKLQ